MARAYCDLGLGEEPLGDCAVTTAAQGRMVLRSALAGPGRLMTKTLKEKIGKDPDFGDLLRAWREQRLSGHSFRIMLIS